MGPTLGDDPAQPPGPPPDIGTVAFGSQRSSLRQLEENAGTLLTNGGDSN